MSLRFAPIFASAGLALQLATAAAQGGAPPSTLLRPLTPTSIAAALERPVGLPAPAARTAGQLALKGQRIYIAEYLLLWDVSGEVPAAARDGHLLGQRLSQGSAVLRYRSQPDITALQALTDRAWADLQARLAAAGVVLDDAATVVREHGAVYPVTESASAPGAPVLLEATVGDTTRRYLMLAPTGMRLVKRSATGIGPGNPAVRQAYTLQGIEALSLAMAINLGVPDGAGQRPPGFDAPGGLPSLSPLMELAPAPAAALVHGHALRGLVNLTEALVPTAAFGRLQRAALDGPIPSNDPLSTLLALGRQAAGERSTPRVDAQLELDGPTTARLMLFVTSAAHQAMADALKAAR